VHLEELETQGAKGKQQQERLTRENRELQASVDPLKVSLEVETARGRSYANLLDMQASQLGSALPLHTHLAAPPTLITT
jgi:hypothetical protein